MLALFAALVGAAAAARGRQLERPAPSSFVDAGAGHDSSSAAGAAGALAGAAVALRLYVRWQKTAACRNGRCAGRAAGPGTGLRASARCWPAPAMEPKPTALPWAVTYTNPLAARWSGTPLGIPLHPVQAYAALAFLALAILCSSGCRRARSRATWPASACWAWAWPSLSPSSGAIPRDAASIFDGALDGPQVAAVCWCLRARWCLRGAHQTACSSRTCRTACNRNRRGRAMTDRAPSRFRRKPGPAARSIPRASVNWGVSRSRVQLLIDQGDVLVDGEPRESLAQAARRRAHRHHRRAASRAAQGHGGRDSARCGL